MFKFAAKPALTVAVAVCAFLIAVSNVRSEEVITRYHSNIDIGRDGQLRVTETIDVIAEGNKIRRGIYRDFPLMVDVGGGKERQVGFDIVSIKRDGRDEPYFTERGRRSIRIYIGDRDIFLDSGTYQYEITYTTDRQIRFFDQYDELFWNVTGNFWEFPINQASANITLPDGASSTDTIAYTGPFGSTEQNAEIQLLEGGNKAFFRTTAPLGLREGLTVGVKMPKGIIAPPTGSQELGWFFSDFRGEILAVIAFLVTSIYYFRNWVRIGRDPEPGVIVPRWDAPDNISPALTNYIHKKGLEGKGWDAISAAILNLAVKGFIKLDNLSDDIRLVATGKQPQEALPVGEAAIFKVIERYDGDLKISKGTGSRVKKLQGDFSSAMSGEHRSNFYKHNIGVIIGGVALSIVSIIVVLALGNLTEDTLGFFIMMAFSGTILTIMLVSFGRRLATGRSLASKISAVVGMGFAAFSGMSLMVPFLMTITGAGSQPVLFTTLFGIVVLNIIFFFLMGAPTPLGREMMDGIEGLKQYLTLAEKDRMNLAGKPEMSPQHFETLLPYAVALGVEKPWSNAFQAWLVTAAAAGVAAASWGPSWYGGRRFEPDRIGETMSEISNTVQNSLTEAMPAPKSSSSGFSSGGGFSGGGGGGGGGGGW